MGTDEEPSNADLLAALASRDWSATIQAVTAAQTRMRGSVEGDSKTEEIVTKVAALASHPKWEVRHAVATAAAYTAHSIFEHALARLALDDNGRVRQAAEHAALRRRDSRYTSALGRQHEDRLNSTLDDIESRFGSKGREAVKRAAEQISDTFARELYHEVIKLLSPLAASADRLRAKLTENFPQSPSISEEAERIGRRVTQLRAVLDAMRAYTAQPALTFEAEPLRELVQEAVHFVLDSAPEVSPQPSIDTDVPTDLVVDVARSRFVQALTNIFTNAIESYRDVDSLAPIRVSARLREGVLALDVSDEGCGMSAEAQRDALTLFATSKPNGTGFGLPLAVKIIEAEHGGRLSIVSAKGRGTTVSVLIPQHRQTARA